MDRLIKSLIYEEVVERDQRIREYKFLKICSLCVALVRNHCLYSFKSYLPVSGSEISDPEGYIPRRVVITLNALTPERLKLFIAGRAVSPFIECTEAIGPSDGKLDAEMRGLNHKLNEYVKKNRLSDSRSIDFFKRIH